MGTPPVAVKCSRTGTPTAPMACWHGNADLRSAQRPAGPRRPRPQPSGWLPSRRVPIKGRMVRDSGAPVSPTGIARERETCADDTAPCQRECRPLRPRPTRPSRNSSPPPIRPKPLQISSIHPSADTKSPRKNGTFSKPIDTALVERSRDEALFAGAGGGSQGIFSCHCVSRYATTDAITPAMTPIPKLPASSSRRCDFLTRPAHTTSPGS